MCTRRNLNLSLTVKNKPDTIVRDQQSKNCLLTDITVPSNYNVIKKDAEKLTQIVAVVVGATGVIFMVHTYFKTFRR